MSDINKRFITIELTYIVEITQTSSRVRSLVSYYLVPNLESLSTYYE